MADHRIPVAEASSTLQRNSTEQSHGEPVRTEKWLSVVGQKARKTPSLGLGSAVSAVVLVLFLPLNNYYLTLLTTAAAYCVAVFGLVVLLGYAGQISLAQASFFGVGAYVTAIGTVLHHLNFWLAGLLGVLVAGALGAVLGVVSLRVGGHYLAMVTISFQVIVSLFLVNSVSLTQGPDGITGIPRPSLGFATLSTNRSYLLFCVVILCVVAVLVWGLAMTRLGRSMRALRENELAAEVLGVPTYRVKVVAFVLSACLAAIGGMLFAGGFQFVSPGDFSFAQSILLLTMTLVGGARSVAGGVIGSLLVVFLPEWLRFLQNIYLAVYGGALILLMVVAPEGIWGFLTHTVQRFHRKTTAPPVIRMPARPAIESNSGTVSLELRGLVKHFGGVRAVDGVDLSVARGEVHSLIGPNGSGKTTILNVVSGIYVPTGGSVWFNGEMISGQKSHVIAQLGIARTFQLLRLLRSESVLENVLLGAQAARPRLEGAELRGVAIEALGVVGMESYAYGPVANLSYGHQRRVEIARALASQPSVVLLDEPGAGLNQTEKFELVEVIARLKSEAKTVVLIEHDLDLVRNVSDTLSVLNFGMLVATGDPSSVLNQPDVQAAYMGVDH